MDEANLMILPTEVAYFGSTRVELPLSLGRLKGPKKKIQQ